jgi:hypothetical protein
VFEKVLFLRETRNERQLWYPLDDLRRSLEMAIEQRFQQRQHAASNE